MSDWLTKTQRSRNMAAIRSSGTSPEIRLGEILRKAAPRRRLIHNATELPGKPDYLLPGLQVAIFLDGCFWHACPKHGRFPEDNADYWVPKLQRNAQRDAQRRRQLRREGFTVWRVWEHELKRDQLPSTERRLKARLGRLSSKR
jgi:DNA mismatch endonuclease (patch repair protein)